MTKKLKCTVYPITLDPLYVVHLDDESEFCLPASTIEKAQKAEKLRDEVAYELEKFYEILDAYKQACDILSNPRAHTANQIMEAQHRKEIAIKEAISSGIAHDDSF